MRCAVLWLRGGNTYLLTHLLQDGKAGWKSHQLVYQDKNKTECGYTVLGVSAETAAR